jgi:hypothetical protein
MDAVEPQIRELLRAYPTMVATVIVERIGWTRSIRVLRRGTTDQQLDRCARPRAPGPATPSSTALPSGRSASAGHWTGYPGLPSRPPSPARHCQPMGGPRRHRPPHRPRQNRARPARPLPTAGRLWIAGKWSHEGAQPAATSGKDAQKLRTAETSESVAMGCDLLLRGCFRSVRRSHFLETVEDQIEPGLELLGVHEAGLGELGRGFGEVGILAGGKLAEDELGHV